MKNNIEEKLSLLCCPKTHKSLKLIDNILSSDEFDYVISEDGIPQFAKEFCSEEAKIQAEHYDTISKAYIENLHYPHTQEYLSYLDDVLIKNTNNEELGNVAEVCCGTGEAMALFKKHVNTGVGIDVSMNMLRGANDKHKEEKLIFIQGDATKLPLSSSSFDNVFCLGGIHHVNDRDTLFSEIQRVLKPGGKFIWREPVDDYFIWRLIRSVIYKISPYLDDDTEQPLRRGSTEESLKKAGLNIELWNTYGFLGFCLFMNSDVLIFNRLFRYIPKIRSIVRLFIKLDELILNNRVMTGKGLQVIGIANKPN